MFGLMRFLISKIRISEFLLYTKRLVMHAVDCALFGHRVCNAYTVTEGVD